MADYIATTAELTAIADAIRSKGGTSSTLAFPDGFVSAIAAISGGGGGLPSGISAIAIGSETIDNNIISGQQTFQHTLGVTPDLFIFYADDDIPYSNTFLFSTLFNSFGKYKSGYTSLTGRHSSGATSSTVSWGTPGIGVLSVSDTEYVLKGGTSSTYYIRGGYQYNWIAIKFA